ncbi:reverse transcriptase domain-containing protein [Tanacetum coccineum]
MPNNRSGASRTREGINEQIDRQVAGALGARTTARNLEPLMRDGGGQEEVNGNGGNGNEGNGNGGNGNGGNRNEGVVGLTRWFEKIETVFHISNCPERTYDVDCPRNEVQKIETELWNLVVKRNDLTTYTRRFQELVLLCTRMGNVIAAEPTKLQDEIRVANNLMDQKLKGYARSAANKRRLDNNPRDNRGQQPVFKRQNVGGQNVARAYTAGNNEKRVTPNTQIAPVGNQPGIVCYECGRQGHFRKDCPKLRNQNHGNKTGNKNGNKSGNQTGSNEATAKAYAIGGGGANPDSNVVTGTFLLNNCCAYVLFDLGADKSFVSSTFSALLDVAPSTLDTSYAIELTDGRIS